MSTSTASVLNNHLQAAPKSVNAVMVDGWMSSRYAENWDKGH